MVHSIKEIYHGTKEFLIVKKLKRKCAKLRKDKKVKEKVIKRVLTNSIIGKLKNSMIREIRAKFLSGAVGSASTTPAVSDVRLVNEIFRDTIDSIGTAVTDQITTTLIINSNEANGNNIREFGWFETSGGSTGTAFVRDTLTSITKTSDIILYLDTTTNVTLIEV